MAIKIAVGIKNLRKAMKLTQGQFAELVEISDSSIGNIERGDTLPAIDTLLRISNKTKIPLSVLLGEEKEKTETQNKALDDLVKYLRTKSPKDIKSVHKVAVEMLERD